MFGALGALYSFLSRLRGLSVDPAAGKQAHHQDAFLRIIIGALGAFIFAIGIKSRLVMGFLEQETDYSTWLFFLLCTAAGYSERLVPDFLQHVESKAVDD